MGSYAQHPAQPVAPPGARRWQQICETVNRDEDEINHVLAFRGGEGWELASVTNYNGFVICYKRPMP